MGCAEHSLRSILTETENRYKHPASRQFERPSVETDMAPKREQWEKNIQRRRCHKTVYGGGRIGTPVDRHIARYIGTPVHPDTPFIIFIAHSFIRSLFFSSGQSQDEDQTRPAAHRRSAHRTPDTKRGTKRALTNPTESHQLHIARLSKKGTQP